VNRLAATTTSSMTALDSPAPHNDKRRRGDNPMKKNNNKIAIKVQTNLKAGGLLLPAVQKTRG
jgi:hypothetical protein